MRFMKRVVAVVAETSWPDASTSVF